MGKGTERLEIPKLDPDSPISVEKDGKEYFVAPDLFFLFANGINRCLKEKNRPERFRCIALDNNFICAGIWSLSEAWDVVQSITTKNDGNGLVPNPKLVNYEDDGFYVHMEFFCSPKVPELLVQEGVFIKRGKWPQTDTNLNRVFIYNFKYMEGFDNQNAQVLMEVKILGDRAKISIYLGWVKLV